MLRAVMGFLAGVFALIAIGAIGVFLYLSQPETPPERTPVRDYSSYVLEEKVGLYKLPDGTNTILTFSARGGLSLFALNDYRFSRSDYLSTRFIPAPDGGFTWDPWSDGEPRTVRFVTQGNQTTAFEWTDESGSSRADRMPTPFAQRDVTWKNGDVKLAGTAFIPARSAGTGAVILHGSGTSHRDNLWYLHIALYLVQDGVAVLLPDKRGSGRSGGEWRTASFTDFAMDGLTGREVLAEHAGLTVDHIGLIGISQGGSWITPIATTMTNDLPFVVNVSGAAVSPNHQLAHETRQTLRMQGIPEFLDILVHPFAVAIPQRRRSIWWDTNGSYDPLSDWQDCWTPALFIYGSEDEFDNVPVSTSVARLRPIAEERDGFEVRVLEGVGHGLMDMETRRMRPVFLAMLLEWSLRYGT